jgi:hypothetical protein
MHGVYKYEYEGKVIYIGKTDNSFENRIYNHSREDKFAPYIDKATISVYETRDKVETDFLETVLINQYRPALNAAKHKVTSVDVCANVQWVPWSGGWKQKRRPDENRTIKGYSFTLREDNMKKMREVANDRGVSVSKLIDHLLEEALKDVEL